MVRGDANITTKSSFRQVHPSALTLCSNVAAIIPCIEQNALAPVFHERGISPVLRQLLGFSKGIIKKSSRGPAPGREPRRRTGMRTPEFPRNGFGKTHLHMSMYEKGIETA